MKLIIDISENLYNFVNTKRPNGCFNEFDKFDTYDISKCIRNGTPLPKGHGDLIDENDLWFEDIANISCVTQRNVENAPTIIEANKGEKE